MYIKRWKVETMLLFGMSTSSLEQRNKKSKFLVEHNINLHTQFLIDDGLVYINRKIKNEAIIVFSCFSYDSYSTA